jgi:predicted HTH domain antitoxin
MLLAVKLVEMGRISTGRASEWVGITKPRFLQEMGRYGLSAFQIDEKTLEQDIINARN